MAKYSYTPSQYYAKTPSVNQTTTSVYNQLVPGNKQSYNNPNRAFLPRSNQENPVPGTVGYTLPAQTYYNYGVNNPGNEGIQTLKTALVATAAVGAASSIFSQNGYNSQSQNRLNASGLGARASDILRSRGGDDAFTEDSEDRVIIYDQSGQFIGNSELFKPFEDLGGVLFPYTPTIQVAHRASYDPMSLVHTNYVTPQYQNSKIDNISVQGVFTANYAAEAEYVVGMIHFFRSVTKMFYGRDSLAGTPPPVLFLDAHGPFLFDHIPVVITSFDYTFPNDVDYISCNTRTQKQKVPTYLQVSLSMLPAYSRNKISSGFGLNDFAAGKLTTGAMSNRRREGGFL